MSTQTYLRMSLYYLLFFTTIGVFTPYFSLYLASQGLSSDDVGLVLAVLPLIGMVVQPLWGMINDRFHMQKMTLLFALLMPPTVLLLFHFVNTFVLYLGATALLAAFQAAAMPVADSMTVSVAGTFRYGKVRMYGSLGYALAVMAAAPFYKHFGIRNIGWLFLITSALALVGLVFYPRPPQRVTVTKRQNPWAGIKRLFRNRRFVLILSFNLLITISQAMNSNFYTLYYHALGRPMGWLGVIYALGALSELPFFFWIGRFIERYGAERVLLLGGTVFFMRWVALGFEPPTWLLLSLQLLHGLSFSLTFTAGVALAAGASADDNQVTAQTLYSAVNMGLAAIVGSVVGGFMLNQFGPRSVYELAAISCGLGLLAMALFVRNSAPKYRL